MKILFLQEYIRENHMKKESDGNFRNVFFTTKAGNILSKLVEDGLGLDKGGYYIDYAYNLVPRVLTRDKFNRAMKYKPPKQSEANEEYRYLYERIVREKPDIIIPTGNLGCKALIGKSAISQLRGVPEKVTIKAEIGGAENLTVEDQQRLTQQLEAAEEELDSFVSLYADRLDEQGISREYEVLQNTVQRLYKQLENNGQSAQVQTHECWVLPMYSMEYMLVNPSIQNLIEADFVTLKKFVDEGEAAFEASPVDYEFVTDIERVREIFKKEVPNAPIVSWDLETNTLHPELPGAKPLVISLSWKEGEGVTIPLEHKDFSWLPGHLNEIYNMVEAFVADSNITKVGHNLQFDIRFLRLTKGFRAFNNNRDTKVMYYLLVNQDVEGSLQLSDLAYELTDMGGYDKALDEFKREYVKNYIAREKERIAQMKAENKQQLEEVRAEIKSLQEHHKLAEKELREFESLYTISDVDEDPDLSREHRLRLEEYNQTWRKIERAEDREAELRAVKFPKAEPPKNEIDGSDFNYEWIPLEEMLHPYASGDVDAGLRIHNRLDEVGKKPENTAIRKLYTGHYTELVSYLAKIEANGVPMNVPYNEELTEAYIEEEERIVEEMRKFPEVKMLEEQHRVLYEKGLAEWAIPKADRDEEVAKLRDKYKKKLKFNPNSPDDKKRVLYDIMGIRLPYNKEYLVDSAVEDGIPEEEIEWVHYKTNKTSLEYIKAHFEEAAGIADMLLTHSLVKTRRRGFTYKLREMIDPQGLLHGGFNATGTATSRLSSQNPNLQQLPRSTGDVTRFDYKYPIKRMFTTRFEGGALIQLDYSSLESRILALAAQDEEMTQAFLDGADIHSETASLVFNIPVEDVTADQRDSAKSTTFGIAYGETPFSYFAKHGMTLQEAEKLFDDYFRNKPKIKQFIDETHAWVKKVGYVETLHGFRRNLRDVYSQDKSKQNGALRQSVNTKIQGSGAFLTNSSVILIQKFIEERNLRSKMVLTVHDSIVIDSPPEEIHIIAAAGKYIMENLPIDWLFIDWKGERIRYPIEADVEVGINYNDMVDYDKDDLNSFNKVENYCKYHLSLKRVKDYKETGLIDEDKFEELTAAIKAKKAEYQIAS